MRVGRVVVVGALGVVALGAGAVAVVARHQVDVPRHDLTATMTGRVESQNGDCGWTAPLAGGQVLWVVCDPNAMAGGLTNSVAVADPGDRAPSFQPANFVPPAPADRDRCSAHGDAASWIDGVTAAPGPTPSTTIVTAFFIHGCRAFLLDGTDPGDFGVATYQYVHGSSGIRRAQVQAWDLFPGEWSSNERTVPFGAGAVYHDGYQYAYACHPAATSHRSNDGQCTVARAARLALPGARESWAFWQGAAGGWVACTSDRPGDPKCSERSFRAAVDAAAPLDMPLPDGESPDGFTPLQFSVSWSQALGRFVSAAPRAFGDPTLRVRVATAPEGPWSAPGDVPVDCDPDVVPDGFNCYHMAPHPELGDSAAIPFTIHDAGERSGADLEVVEIPVCELNSLAGHPCPSAG